jgi:electron transfer flavoprotein beta subunit
VLAVPPPAVLSVEGGVARLRRASLPAEVAARAATIEVVAGPAGPIDHATAVRPYRPRARAMAAPAGDALARIRSLTGAGAAPATSTAETVVLEPAAAAERILAALRTWGHLDA